MPKTITVTATTATILQHAVEFADPRPDDSELRALQVRALADSGFFERQADTLDQIGYLLAGKSVVDVIEQKYVRALNSVLAAADGGSADAHRWRGHAEAYRTVLERLRQAAGLPAVAYTSAEWRAANGVYTDAQVGEFRRIR